jgi:hypothetical protein
VGLIKGENNEGPTWPLVRVQQTIWIYETTKLLARLLNPLVVRNVSGRAIGTSCTYYFAVSRKLEKPVTLTEIVNDTELTFSAELTTSL